MKRSLLISFFGSSGTGKSTCYGYAESYLREHGYEVYRANVAKPLRLIQNYASLVFGGNYQDPDNVDFKQDGQLLGFLAKHFEDRLGLVFRETVENLLGRAHDRKIAIINTDCRNNAYKTLKDLGFVFIKVETSEDTLNERRKARGDLTPFDRKSSVEQYDRIKELYMIRNDGSHSDLKICVENVLDQFLK